MQTVTVPIPGIPREYSVYIEAGLLNRCAAYFEKYRGHVLAIISDEHVAPLYARVLMDQLQEAGVSAVLHVLPAGETTKSAQYLDELYTFLLDHKITRADGIIALGGGVIGDLTGYAAATYLRGVPLIQIPTTLLAQVDSSVGGKVAINHPRGKNLLGNFYQPEMVLIDTDTLTTLDARQVGAGLGEVLKYGCILDSDLFATLESQTRDTLPALYPGIIARCIQLKADVVAEDPHDLGLRMILNFGHTLAHAIENAEGYGVVLHGEAVCIGMLAAAGWGESLGITPAGTEQRIYNALVQLDLPHALPDVTPEALFKSLILDKKSAGKMIRVILLDEIGRCHAESLSAETVEALQEARMR